jgi:AAA+ superfamily predicted ATPase
MLNLDNCITAHRPCTFVTCESDVEVLEYINTKYNVDNYSVYSQSMNQFVKLADLMGKLEENPNTKKTQFKRSPFTYDNKTNTLNSLLTEILNTEFTETNITHYTYIFLDCDNYVAERSNLRRIKDILGRYQIDQTFTINLIFLSQTLCVPPLLERLSEVVFYDLPDEMHLKETSDNIITRLDLTYRLEQKEEDTFDINQLSPEEKEAREKRLSEDAKLNDSEKEKIKEDLSAELVNNLRGLTLFETEQAYLQSLYLYKRIDLNFIRNFKKSSVSKTELLSLLESDTTFDDIGGMITLKKWIKKSAGGWTIKGKEFGLPAMKGLLLVGLPGTGKSMICKAIGNEWGLPVVSFDPSRVFSSRVGESEHNIRRVLNIVENLSPCIMFLDEVEKGFAGSQSSTFSDSGVTARVIGTFLTWMQDCNKSVFTVATSNNIRYLPPEMIQRFDETFFVNLPQQQERIDILKIHLELLKRDPRKFNLEQLSEHSKDLSGREIEQVLREAMYDAYSQGKDLSTEIILNVLIHKTNLLTTMAEQLKYLLDWVGWDPEKKDGVRARFSHPNDEDNVSRIRDEIADLIKEVEKGNPDKKDF